MKNANDVIQTVGVLKENQIFLPVTLCLLSFLVSFGNINLICWETDASILSPFSLDGADLAPSSLGYNDFADDWSISENEHMAALHCLRFFPRTVPKEMVVFPWWCYVGDLGARSFSQPFYAILPEKKANTDKESESGSEPLDSAMTKMSSWPGLLHCWNIIYSFSFRIL